MSIPKSVLSGLKPDQDYVLLLNADYIIKNLDRIFEFNNKKYILVNNKSKPSQSVIYVYKNNKQYIPVSAHDPFLMVRIPKEEIVLIKLGKYSNSIQSMVLMNVPTDKNLYTQYNQNFPKLYEHYNKYNLL